MIVHDGSSIILYVYMYVKSKLVKAARAARATSHDPRSVEDSEI